jgi:tRNA A-37 threonylcarbamoyl transferase component Bud32
MSFEGEGLKTVKANTIQLSTRDKARNEFDLIHEMGVYFTDIKNSNVCKNIDRQQIVFIDFRAF